MTSPFPSLLGFYLRSVYALPAIRKGGRIEAKALLKTVGIVFLFVLVAADVGVLFVANNLAMYAALEPAGLQELLLLNAATSSAMIVFVLGFATALSTYCMSAMEGGLLALPIKPRHLLGAKALMVYVSEALVGALLVGIAVAVFGIKEGAPPAFYLAGLLVALGAPLAPLAVSYLIIVPLMSLARFRRNKNALMVLGGAVGLVFALLFNVYVQSAAARLGDSAWILENFAGPDSLIARAGAAYPPSFVAWRSLALAARPGSALAGLGTGLLLVAGGAALLGAVVALLGPRYAKSLSDFGESSMRRLGRAELGRFLERGFRARPLGLALLSREWDLMNREPAYFLNGPFTVVIGPLILGIMMLAQGETYAQLAPVLEAAKSGPWGLMAAAAFGTFVGSGTSITCTSLSRDAKALSWLKALPLDPARYMLAKFWHGFLVSVVGVLVGAGGGSILLGLSIPETAGAVFTALAFCALVDLAGLWLDTANPRLRWDNPIAALKQNPNAVILILGLMAVLGGLGYLATLLPMGKAGFVALFGGGSALLFLAALLPYPAYARRRIAALEP